MRIPLSSSYIKSIGAHDLLFFKKNGTYFHKQITLTEGHQHHINITEGNTDFKKDGLNILASILDGSYITEPDFIIPIEKVQPLTEGIQAYGDSSIFYGSVFSYYVKNKEGYLLVREVGTSKIIKKEAISSEQYVQFNLAPGVYDIEAVVKDAETIPLESLIVLPNTVIKRDFDLKLDVGTGIVLRGFSTRQTSFGAFEKAEARYMFSGGSDKETVPIDGIGSLSTYPDQIDEDDFNTEAYLVGDYDGLADRKNYQRGSVMGYLSRRKDKLDAPYDMIANNTSRLPVSNSIRTNFKDLAYWQPNLITDPNGETYFSVQFPDNVTSWRTSVIGMDDKLRSGFTQMNTQAFKPVMAQLVAPRFLIEGDKAKVIGKAINYTSDSFTIETQFSESYAFNPDLDKVLKSTITPLKDAFIEKIDISSIMATDSFKVSYQLEMDNYLDGEERVIPVYKKGITETQGAFFVLEGDTTIDISLENTKNSSIYLTAYANGLDLMLEDIQYLKNYPYQCNEQNASRLTALLLEERIKKQLNEPFNDKGKIVRTIRRLQKTQNDDGSWGWWNDSPANTWMTMYVLEALDKAQKNGYTINDAKNKGLAFLVNHHKDDVNYRYDYLNYKNLLIEICPSCKSELFEYKQFDTTKLSLHDQMQWIKVLQHHNQPYSLERLDNQMKRTTTGGIYFGEYNYDWRDNSIQLCLLAHDIYKKAGREDICKGIRQYLLEKRQHNGWRNTFESAQILDLILPYMLNGQPLTLVTLTNNASNTSIPLTDKPSTIQLEEAPTTITKRGTAPVFLSVYSQFHNENPTAKSDIFQVNTSFYQKGKLLEDNISLVKNENITLKAKVVVKEAAEYIMIEIPIPAGCSYGSKPKGYDVEVHREYFKNKVSIFCQHLPVGTYEFSIPLEARFSGTFTVNAAKVEQMYFPIFYGRNETKQVEVK